MKRLFILFAALTGITLLASAEVTLNFNTATVVREYFPGFGYFFENGSGTPFDSKITHDNIILDWNSKVTLKSRLRGDFLEQLSHIKKYSCEEFNFVQSILVTSYTNYSDHAVTMNATTTWQEVGSDEVHVFHGSGNFPVNDTKEGKFVVNNRLYLTESYPVLKLDKTKYYDVTIVIEHETDDAFDCHVASTTRTDVLNDIVDPTFVSENGGYMTVQYDDETPIALQSLFLYDGTKACNNLYSGIVNMTDKTGNATTVDNGGSSVRYDIQPNYRPVVRLYDLNSEEWLATARCYEAGGYSSPSGDGNVGTILNTYFVTADSLVAKHDFTNGKSLDDGGYYTEMELDGNGALCFNSGPLDYTHTYALVVATSSAGWAGSIWNFKDGKIKDINTLRDITNYTPEVIALDSDARKNKVEVNVNIKIDPDFYTAIDDIDADSNEPAVYYNLSGHSSSTPFAGLNIVKRGNKVTKEMYNL